MGRRRGSVGTGAFVVVALAAVVGWLGVSGNLGAVGQFLGFTTGEVETGDDRVEPGDDSGAWSCFWEPTMNDDWHDDVLCARGLETIRPTLLPDQSFVTEDEMMVAAAEYEATLND
ncbi:MAG: hypothetical protein WBL06_14695 [Pseudolysinimonas sp.]|jgi:hypothetical protein|uniref:hypothetical protein n=1 Tax=Pseudolysinimonas sp. TaxID=2680009 RepID=UPI003C775A7F